jgi:predicted metalloprotease with PDZ domain
MLLMNQRFGRLSKGYTLADFYAICEEVYQAPLSDFFQKWYEGNECLLEDLNELLDHLGLKVVQTENGLMYQ